MPADRKRLKSRQTRCGAANAYARDSLFAHLLVTRDRSVDHASLTAIHALAQAGDHAQAATLAEASLADGLEHPLIYNLAALRFEQQGRFDEAARLLSRAVELDPDDLGSRNALGLCLMRLDRPAAAIVHFDALLGLDATLPFAHASIGGALLALGLVAEAENSYRRAIELDANQGIALAGLAHLASRRGAYPESRLWAQKALRALPGLPDAVMSLATAELGEGDIAGAEARVRALLDDARLAPLERAYAEGLLGDVLDAKEYIDEAFAAYTRCNDSLRHLYEARFQAPGNALDFVQSMNRHFERASPKIWNRRATPDSRHTGAAAHVFVLGFPRSGTTLLEVVLEGHPNVVSLEENESLIDAIEEFMERPEDLERLAAASSATLERLRAAYWRRVQVGGVDVAGKMFVDKNPLNSLKLALISRLFPDAKILLACRDPRDVVLSCYRHRFTMSAPIYELLTLEGAARYYDAVMQLVVLMSNLMPLEICLVRHEDVVTEFRREMRRICAFLGIEWEPAMGDFALRTKNRTSLTPSTAQLAKGLRTEGLGQWRRYRSHLSPVLPIVEPWLNRFLYQT
jgi:tetratricopeptide (TPR) repeat protein